MSSINSIHKFYEISTCVAVDSGLQPPDFPFGTLRKQRKLLRIYGIDLAPQRCQGSIHSLQLRHCLSEFDALVIMAPPLGHARNKKCTREDSNLKPSVPKTDALSN